MNDEDSLNVLVTLKDGQYWMPLKTANVVLKIMEEQLAREDALTSALISMVQQYLYRPLDNKTREPAEQIYQHDFMSAGEEACRVLVDLGLAEWTDDDKYAIILKEAR